MAPGDSRRAGSPPEIDLPAETAGIAGRAEAIRQAAALPGAEPRLLLDAALTEIEAALAALRTAVGRDHTGSGPGPDPRPAARALRAVFQQAPMPLLVLGRDGVIRRANLAAAELLGAGPGYPTGKHVTALIDPPDRAAVQSGLAAACRSDAGSDLRCGLLAGHGIVRADLAFQQIQIRGEDDQILAAVTGVADRSPPADGTARSRTARSRTARSSAARSGPAADAGGGMAGQARRLDLMLEVGRLLLDNLESTAAVLVQRLARLLADHLAAWVLVDLPGPDGLRRACVAGPDTEDAVALGELAMEVGPAPGSVPAQVAESGDPVLLADAEEAGLLGLTGDETPLLLALRGTCVLSAPVPADDGASSGALTLVRAADVGRLGLADLAVAGEIARQLGQALVLQRSARRRLAVVTELQDSVLPRRLRAVPGVRSAAAHVAPTRGIAVSGDFYDVYPMRDGWGLAIGDVCGRDRGTAAVTAAARHTIRVLAHRSADPASVLRGANELLLAQAFDATFVTATAARLTWRDERLRVVLASAGHPGPVLVGSDGRIRPVAGGGVPLGVFDPADLEIVRHRVELAPGELLFFCTDGVTDARGAGPASFGDQLADRLTALAGLPPGELVAGLRQSLIEFCGGELIDSASMLVIQAAEPPA
ncbi:MAG: SpoIIE family protein phosphatase [Actinomycetota bacterium]|nr:SpoIIE family protein phosphatase [Actinomycetota bacterium]